MEQHVKEREFNLTHAKCTGLIVFGGNHFVKEFVGELFTRFDVSGDALDNFVFPSEVFEELAGQFDRVPLDAVDAGDLRFGLSGEDVVQRMAEFMEKRRYFVVRHRGFTACLRGCKVGDKISDRSNELAVFNSTSTFAVHPGAGALAFSGIEVSIEGGNFFTVALHFKILDIWMPDGGLSFFDFDAKELFDQAEKSLEDCTLCEVALHFRVGIAVAGFAKLFCSISAVPRLNFIDAEFVSSIGVDLSDVVLCTRFRAAGKIAQKVQYFRRALGHLGRKRQFTVILKAEQRRFFSTQFENALDERRVVKFAAVKFRGACGERTV